VMLQDLRSQRLKEIVLFGATPNYMLAVI